ncbi:HD-GYP domain-containing protein [Bacillus sp. V3B]|uniref:HD-GYP domain-containing protein n=1 Tax=Bacillus sp. V3B TaxID=2804915 RepID=UPI00210928E2|nr:HD-GYP domain-containing protein [Bacillus sp. V3B]MCQ6276555.1 HD-GYP domain-containing protein [Bacillus sp. V3B]
MRLVATSSVEVGTKLGKVIYNEKGKVLVNKGVTLDGRMLKRLIQLGITYIYIEDKKTADIIFKEPISTPLKQEAMTTIIDTFNKIQSEPISSRSFVLEKSVKEFKAIIQYVMSELHETPELMSILSDVCIHDTYIFTHSLNVTLYSLAVGIELKLPSRQLEEIGIGAIMHDIGKVAIPKEILLKPGKLTDEEFTVIKTHATEGFDLLRNTHTVPLLVAHCAFQHHERLDGSGYPRGIRESDIHDYAKIIAVADVFDAVTSNRVYRPAMLPHEGLEMLYAGVERQFHTNIVEAFHKSVAIYPNGITVELNDGRKGVVVRQNVALSDRPIVRILEENGHEMTPYEINLEKELSVVVTGCDITFKKD